MQKKSIDKWVTQGKKNCKSYVFYEDKVLDLSQFMLEHPGGIKAIKNYVFKDITNILFEVYPHPKDSTLPRLMKYQVGLIPEQESHNVRHKAEKSPHPERPKQKKKVCFTSQNQKLLSVKDPKNSTNQSMSKSLKKSRGKSRQNMRESTAKSNASKATSKSKSKKKQFLTSIRIINEDQKKSYDDYFQQNQQKIRQKQRSNTEKRKQKKERPVLGSCSFVNNQLDQEKPNFKVPVLFVKHMNRHV